LGLDASSGVVQGRLFQVAFYLFCFATTAIVLAIRMNWHNSRAGFWLNAVIVGIADIPFILFEIVPGYVPFWPGILGPALWVDPASGSSALTGAWFAMPDPDARRDFTRDFSAQFKEPPQPRADLAYDAASIARVLGQSGTITQASLTQPAGFAGVDGWFALMADGRVRRGLAVFRVDRARPTKIGESPVGLGAPGS